jgi:hypothetical protein
MDGVKRMSLKDVLAEVKRTFEVDVAAAQRNCHRARCNAVKKRDCALLQTFLLHAPLEFCILRVLCPGMNELIAMASAEPDNLNPDFPEKTEFLRSVLEAASTAGVQSLVMENHFTRIRTRS